MRVRSVLGKFTILTFICLVTTGLVLSADSRSPGSEK